MILANRSLRLRLNFALPRLSTGIWIIGFVGLGLLLRFAHFLRFPSIWHDEAALLINVVRLEFRQMFGPLLVSEAAPPLFLVVERAISLLLGDGVTALRLLPFLASCGSLVGVALLARRTLPDRAAPWAVALFAVSDRMLWHAIEAKPYSIDVFVAVAVAYGFVATRPWPIWKQALLWLSVLPTAIWVSYPACFVCGGLFAGMLPALLRSRSARDWLACFVLAVAVGLAFFLLATGPAKAQRDNAMEGCWTDGFPNWQRPWTVPFWIVRSTFGVFSYSIGPDGWAFVGLIVAGGVFLWRKGESRLLAVLLLPMGLTLFAALIGKYPYSDSRVIAFLAPAICLLTAAGIPVLIDWLRGFRLVPSGTSEVAQSNRWSNFSRRFSGLCELVVWVLLVIPFLQTAHRVVFPWYRADSEGACKYVLDHWQSGDAVVFDNWDSEYYLRQKSDHWLSPAKPFDMTSKRIWFVSIAILAEHRNELMKKWMPPSWRTVNRYEFTGVTVALFVLEKSAEDSTSRVASLP